MWLGHHCQGQKVKVTRPLWSVVLAGQHGRTVMVTYPYAYMTCIVSPLAGLGGGHIMAAARLQLVTCYWHILSPLVVTGVWLVLLQGVSVQHCVPGLLNVLEKKTERPWKVREILPYKPVTTLLSSSPSTVVSALSLGFIQLFWIILKIVSKTHYWPCWPWQ